MTYDELIDYIIAEMKNQSINKTNMARILGKDIRVLNNYMRKTRYMPIDCMISILKVLGKEITIIDRKG